MKYLLINSVCGIGSTGRICTDIADAMTALGHTVRIAYGRESVPEKYQKYAHRICQPHEYRTDAVKVRIFDNAGLNNRRATEKFITWIEQYDPDIIHLHNLHGYYINIEVLFSYLKQCGKKIIWTLHDCWPFTGHCAHYSDENCFRWLEKCNHCPLKKAYPASLIRDGSEKNFSKKKELFCGVPDMTIVTPSEWLKKEVKRSFLSEYPVLCIHNGIRTELFSHTPDGDLAARYSVSGKKIILGVANIWSRRKGYEDFLKLSGVLPEAYKIVLIGLNKKQIRRLPKEILGLENTQSVNELAEWYSMSYVFFNPTYSDNYPTTNLEAQSCGTPVVTYRTGGSPESVPSENVLEQGDIKGFLSLLKKGEEMPFLIERSRDIKEMLQEYLELCIR